MVTTILLSILGYMVSTILAYCILAFCEFRTWKCIIPIFNTAIVLLFIGALFFYGIKGIKEDRE